jgi:hypothetical protein
MSSIFLQSSPGVSTFVANSIVQSSHGFSVGNIVRHNGTIYVKSQADSGANAEMAGIVSAVGDANSFTITTDGYVSGLSGLTAGTVYFLSPTTAGAMTATEPTTIGQVSKPVFQSDSTTSGYVLTYRGVEVPPASGINIGAAVSGSVKSFGLGVDTSNNLAQTMPTVPVLHNPQLVPFKVYINGGGRYSVYTVPTGKRAMLLSSTYTAFNPHATNACQVFQEIQIGASYYRLMPNSSISASNFLTILAPIVFEAGESFIINMTTLSTGRELYAYGSMILFDNTSPVKTVKKYDNWIVGDNTIATVPAGETWISCPGSATMLNGMVTVNITNGTSGSITFKHYYVESGESVGASTQITTPTALGTTLRTQYAFYKPLVAGSSYVVNSTSNGSIIAWILVYVL